MQILENDKNLKTAYSYNPHILHTPFNRIKYILYPNKLKFK